jgi:hypothetical protein
MALNTATDLTLTAIPFLKSMLLPVKLQVTFHPVHQKSAADCIEPFICIMAGTTQAWLQKALTERDI